MRSARYLPFLLVAVLAAGLMGTAVAQPGGPTAFVVVVHGIPGATVDVYVNGDLAIPDFEPTTVTDPIELPAGSYDLDVYAAGADPETEDPVVAASDVELTPGLNASVVAHLTEDGEPTLGVVVNDTSGIDADTARVAVRHTAAAPAVDVFVNGDVAIPGLENPDEAVVEVPADTYEVAVAVAGADIEDAVIGPVDLDFAAATLTIVYAVFSAADGDIQALVQTVDLDGVDEEPEPVEPPADTRETSRLEGPTRIETAVAVSQRAFPDTAAVVYLARADDFPDALAAGALTDGPILLVPSCGELPAAVAEEIDRLDAAEVIALGGVNAICDDMLDQAAAA